MSEDLFGRFGGLIESQQHQHRITRDKANRATVNQVLDARTRRFLNALKGRNAFGELGDCVSTGKEANVYSGTPAEEGGKPLAIKIYKTSILVFKDRSKYVVGEHRFNSQSKNPRQMVQQWAEKEFRNLKRIYQDPLLNSPMPVDIKQNVLVMEYLTMNGGESPSPKLRDHPFKDDEEIGHFYLEMLILMRALYQRCHLVHADLSEYNTIVHEDKLYVFDVSQSVEPSHPMALDFLRMDIKNINDFFSRTKKINVYSERDIFDYIIKPEIVSDEFKLEQIELKEKWLEFLHNLPLKTGEDDDFNDQIFRSLHLITSLHQLDEDDYSNFKDVDTLGELVGETDEKNVGEDEENDDDEATGDEDSDLDSTDDESGDDSEENEIDTGGLTAGALRQKKNQDKSLLKAEKAKMKEEKREKRKTKMKKHVKKRLVKKSSNKKNIS